jgi:hypothetical protein
MIKISIQLVRGMKKKLSMETKHKGNMCLLCIFIKRRKNLYLQVLQKLLPAREKLLSLYVKETTAFYYASVIPAIY